MPNLNWKLLTKKRPGVTRGVPPGKEDLAWVTNTVTLIYGERDAVLVDTFLSVQHSKELVDWLVEGGKNLVRPRHRDSSRSEAVQDATRVANKLKHLIETLVAVRQLIQSSTTQFDGGRARPSPASSPA